MRAALLTLALVVAGCASSVDDLSSADAVTPKSRAPVVDGRLTDAGAEELLHAGAEARWALLDAGARAWRGGADEAYAPHARLAALLEVHAELRAHPHRNPEIDPEAIRLAIFELEHDTPLGAELEAARLDAVAERLAAWGHPGLIDDTVAHLESPAYRVELALLRADPEALDARVRRDLHALYILVGEGDPRIARALDPITAQVALWQALERVPDVTVPAAPGGASPMRVLVAQTLVDAGAVDRPLILDPDDDSAWVGLDDRQYRDALVIAVVADVFEEQLRQKPPTTIAGLASALDDALTVLLSRGVLGSTQLAERLRVNGGLHGLTAAVVGAALIIQAGVDPPAEPADYVALSAGVTGLLARTLVGFESWTGVVVDRFWEDWFEDVVAGAFAFPEPIAIAEPVGAVAMARRGYIARQLGSAAPWVGRLGSALMVASDVVGLTDDVRTADPLIGWDIAMTVTDMGALLGAFEVGLLAGPQAAVALAVVGIALYVGKTIVSNRRAAREQVARLARFGLGPTRATPIAGHDANGHTGGTRYRDLCPRGQVVMAVSGTVRDAVFGSTSALASEHVEPLPWSAPLYNLGLKCGAPDRGTGAVVGWSASTRMRGPMRDWPFRPAFTRACPEDMAVVGIGGRAGELVDRLEVRCAPLELDGHGLRPGAPVELTAIGGRGGAPAPRGDCPTGEVAVGAEISAGGAIDAVGLLCAPLTDGGPW